MKIKEHLNFLLKEYNLDKLYKKFIILSVVTSLVMRIFYWSLIVFSEIIGKKPELIKIFSVILLVLYSITIPFQNISRDVTANFLKEIKLANTNYFNDKIINMNKYELLNFNLNEYHFTLNNFNEILEQYILNNKNEYEIPFYFTTLLIIAINKKNGLIIALFAIFYVFVRVFNEIRILHEKPIIKEVILSDRNIRNYVSNSKIHLINNEINKDYLTNNINNYEESKFKINKLDNILDNKTNFIMLLFIIILISSKIKNLNQYDFFYYFLITYDIEYTADKMTHYYKNASVNKIEERLAYLYNINCNPPFIVTNNTEPIAQIKINYLKNKNPKVEINNPLTIKGHILINGISGSGKTSLLYILKGILTPDVINIEPNINNIINQSYISLPNNKSFESDYLYNIISNYETNPNIDIINYAIKNAKMEHKFINNDFIDIQKLSSGERVRLYISQIIYIVLTKKYNILLFDELDENLNNDIAVEICNNIKDIFKDKIILYISHNKAIQKLFNKTIIVDDGVISDIKINQ
jgi:ABC-type lipoprotein export system ATPase subunit